MDRNDSLATLEGQFGQERFGEDRGIENLDLVQLLLAHRVEVHKTLGDERCTGAQVHDNRSSASVAPEPHRIDQLGLLGQGRIGESLGGKRLTATTPYGVFGNVQGDTRTIGDAHECGRGAVHHA